MWKLSKYSIRVYICLMEGLLLFYLQNWPGTLERLVRRGDPVTGESGVQK